jgi:adenine-specific DNA methylase
MGNGYNEKFHLPQHINNESYVLEINSSGVYVNSHYQLTKDDIIARDIYYNNKKSKNIFLTPDNTYTFTNKNGQIHIYNG